LSTAESKVAAGDWKKRCIVIAKKGRGFGRGPTDCSSQLAPAEIAKPDIRRLGKNDYLGVGRQRTEAAEKEHQGEPDKKKEGD